MCAERAEFIPNVWCGGKFGSRYEDRCNIRTFRGRRSVLSVLEMSKSTFCRMCQAQGIVRLRGLVEVNVAVTLAWACRWPWFGGAGFGDFETREVAFV